MKKRAHVRRVGTTCFEDISVHVCSRNVSDSAFCIYDGHDTVSHNFQLPNDENHTEIPVRCA